MTTWHTDKFASYGSTTLNDAIDKAMKASGMHDDQRYFKVVSCGRGVVIMPDSDRTAIAKPGEVMKMLGANETLVKFVRNNVMTIGGEVIEMELPAPAETFRKDFTFTDSGNDEHYLVRITNDQLNLLDWLDCHDLLRDCFDWESGHITNEIEEI